MGFDHHDAKIYQFPVTEKNSVTAQDSGATEDTGAQRATPDSGDKAQSGALTFLGMGRIDFKPEDFKKPSVAPVIARFLIDYCERLAAEKLEILSELRALRHISETQRKTNSGQSVQIATLSGQVNGLMVNEILFFVCSTAGAAGVPISLGVQSLQNGHDLGIYGMIASGLLIGGSVILRAIVLFGRRGRPSNES